MGKKDQSGQGETGLVCLQVCSELPVLGQLHHDPDWPSHGTDTNQLDNVLVVELLHYIYDKKENNHAL